MLIVDHLAPANDWVSDYERSLCPVCTRHFTTFRRKHHCRLCGEVVCGNCTLRKNVKLNILSTMGTSNVRICLSCIVTNGNHLLDNDHKHHQLLLYSPCRSPSAATFTSSMHSPRPVPFYHQHSKSSSSSSTISSSSQESRQSRQNPHLHSPLSTSQVALHGHKDITDDECPIHENESPIQENESHADPLDWSWDNPWPRPPQLAQERERVHALKFLHLLDAPPSPNVFDQLCAMACERTQCPVAAVSFIDSERQWFKAHVGLAQTSIPRDIALCAHVLESREPLVVTDTTLDPRFCMNPLVTGATSIRFYAAAPLWEPRSGLIIGTLFVWDTIPRDHCVSASAASSSSSSSSCVQSSSSIPCDVLMLTSILKTLAIVAMENFDLNIVKPTSDLILSRGDAFSRRSSTSSTEQTRSTRGSSSDFDEHEHGKPAESTTTVASMIKDIQRSSSASSSPIPMDALPSSSSPHSPPFAVVAAGATGSDTRRETTVRLESLLQSLLSRTSETQAQLASQQMSLCTQITDHAARIEELATNLARMEAKMGSH